MSMCAIVQNFIKTDMPILSKLIYRHILEKMVYGNDF
jgi:hypothetical protein